MQNNPQAFFAEAEKEIKRRRYLRRFLKYYHMLLGKSTLREVVRHGIRFKFRYLGLRSYIIRGKGKLLEWDLIRYFFTRAHNQQCEIFLDVGANIGYYSLLAAKMQIFKEIHAVEPIAENFQLLTWHINANNFSDNITAHNVAASNQNGTVQMLNTEEYATGASAIIKGDGAKKGTEEFVTATTLDSLFDFQGRKLAIKMDVEGHERAALQGAEKLLAQNDIFLQVEIWNENTETVEYLLSQGFNLVNFHAHSSFYADFHFERRRLC